MRCSIYFLAALLFVGIACSTSKKQPEQLDEGLLETEALGELDKEVKKETFPPNLLGEWQLLLKQSDTPKFEIINPCNGSAGLLRFDAELTISSGQEAMSFRIKEIGSKQLKVEGNNNENNSFKYEISKDSAYLNIIPAQDFPTAYLFGNFSRAIFDSLLSNTGTKDTLRFIRHRANWNEFLAKKGINQVYLDCDEDLFD